MSANWENLLDQTVPWVIKICKLITYMKFLLIAKSVPVDLSPPTSSLPSNIRGPGHSAPKHDLGLSASTGENAQSLDDTSTTDTGNKQHVT